MSSWSDGPPATGLTPSVWTNGRDLGFTLGGTMALDLGRGNDLPPTDAGYRKTLLELGVSGGRGTLRTAGASAALSARAHLVRRSGGAWLAVSEFQSENDARTLPLFGAGWWLQRGRFTVTSQAVQLLGPLRVTRLVSRVDPDTSVRAGVLRTSSVEVTDVRLLTGAEASVAYTLNRLTLQSRVGVALGVHQRPARWSEAWAGFWARPSMAVFARMRSANDVPAALEAVAGTQTAVGIRITPGRLGTPGSPIVAAPPRDFRVAPADGERHRFMFHVAARRLEVCCDATDWHPVAAHTIGLGSDWWEVVLAVSPGVHRVAIRIDGRAWQSPPGVPATPDEFGGEAGLVVID